MMKAMNEVRIAGYVYDISKLEKKIVKNETSANYGKEFIGGRIQIATDEEGLNVVEVNYTFVTPTFAKSGRPDSRYDVLSKILDTKRSWMNVGKDEAIKVRLTGNAQSNDYINRAGQMTSANTIVGGFNLDIINELPEKEEERNQFRCDVLLEQCTHIEADEEKKIPSDFLRLKGYVFNYNGTEFYPMDFTVHLESGFPFFEAYDMTKSNPVFTKIWGPVVSMTKVHEVVHKSGFGKDSVERSIETTREWVVEGANEIPYEFDDEGTLTKAEVAKMAQAREAHLAEVKTRYENSQNSAGSKPTSFTSAKSDTTGKIPVGQFPEF